MKERAGGFERGRFKRHVRGDQCHVGTLTLARLGRAGGGATGSTTRRLRFTDDKSILETSDMSGLRLSVRAQGRLTFCEKSVSV